jgi:hypothetical protein
MIRYIILIVTLLTLIGCTSLENIDKSPEDLVINYFDYWSNSDYAPMYNYLSDGFKELEPTANTLENFITYAENQGITNIDILEIKETKNDGKSATVYYNVIFYIGEKKIPYDHDFTLKYRENDINPGWKLIHPYGDNIDTS